MKPTKRQNKILAILAMAAVVLCTLPLLVMPQKRIYVYTVGHQPDAEEKNFMEQLQKLGFKLELNGKKNPKDDYILWFATPEYALELNKKSSSKYDFIYSDAHYPFDWRHIKKLPVMLTPHQDLYEHYMRSNIKSAKIDIKEPTAAKRFIEIYQWIKENN